MHGPFPCGSGITHLVSTVRQNWVPEPGVGFPQLQSKPILAGDVGSNSYDPGISLAYSKKKSFKMVQNPGERLIFCSSYTMRVNVAMSRYTLY